MSVNLKPLVFRILYSGLWLTSFGLLALALCLEDPQLSPVRHGVIDGLIASAAALLFCFTRFTRAIPRVAGCLVLCAAIGAGLLAELSFYQHRSAILNNEWPEARQLGEHFIVGFDDWNTVQNLAEQGLIGGIYITRRNLTGMTFDSLRQRIADLQTLRYQAGLPPLLVTADQEGGFISHLSPVLPRREGLSALAERTPRPALEIQALAAGVIQGQDLRNLGVNINLSPVVDLKVARENNPLDLHTQIARRAISSDPQITTEVARSYVQGMRSQGVYATLKHFPGLGDVRNDTHHFSADLLTPEKILLSRDWRPFLEITTQTDALIMLGHVRVPELDKDNPASFSKPIVQKLIREDWQYQGVLMTDDLTMEAAYNYGFCAATTRALNAGVDLLLVTFDHEKIYDALYCVARSQRQGWLDRQQLEFSRKRLEVLREPLLNNHRDQSALVIF